MSASLMRRLADLVRIAISVACLIGVSETTVGEDSACEAAPKIDQRRWSEDFSDPEAWPRHWVPYGRLSNGQWAQGLEGHWPGGPGKNYARPEWWQAVEGTLVGQNFPDEQHPAGLTHRISGDDVRLRCRIKLAAGSVAIVRFFGKSVGKFPPEKTDNHVTALNISTDGLQLWHGSRLRTADAASPSSADEAGANGKATPRFQNTRSEKTEKAAIVPDVWHDVVFELRGTQAAARLDHDVSLIFDLESRQPLESLSLEVNGNKTEIGAVWFDDLAFEPLADSPG